MAVLVGIDEAGLGPILGPLVVSSAAFSVDREHLKTDLWKLLKKSVGKTRSRLKGRLLINDSKKAFSKSLGILHLQRTVLASLHVLDRKPGNLDELITHLCGDRLERLDAYPWYSGRAEARLSFDEADIRIASGLFQRDLVANGMSILDCRCMCYDVAHYNKLIETMRNKASVVFTATAGLINEAWEKYRGEDLQIVVDRQGGRVRYGDILRKMWGGLSLTILQESDNHSSYELCDGSRKMRVHFVVGADSRYMPVSLASMQSKYLRELMMGCINRHFRTFDENLKPTAGYWQDGLRFIGDLDRMASVNYLREQLIRLK